MTGADVTFGQGADPLGIVGSTVAEKYQIEKFVAEGGFSLLYKAEHRILKQPVAVKFLTALSAAPPEQRETLFENFRQEGRLLRTLSSRTASILQAYDVDTYVTASGEWLPYLILEWLDGKPLDAIIDQEREKGATPWSLDAIVKLLEPAAKALEVVHRKGITHRDIKPANIFIVGNPHDDDAFVKVLDFGIAKVISDLAELSAAKAQTGTGITSFTPWYGAPEQFSRRYGATGPWTDVFALALIIVEMLTLRPPLEGNDLPALALESTNPAIRPTPRTKGVLVSDAVEAVFLRAFALQTTDRYETAGQFWNELCEALGHRAQMIELGAPSLQNPGMYGSTDVSLQGRVSIVPAASRELSALPIGATMPSSVGATELLRPGTMPVVAQTIPNPQPSRSPLVAIVAALTLGLGGLGAFFALSKGPPTPAQLVPSAIAPSATTSASAEPAASAAAPTCPDGMVPIPGGDFYMGLDEEQATPGEKPQHQVTLEPYCVDVTEVTVEAYRACSDAGRCPRAATEVSWPGITSREKKIYGPLCNVDDAGRDKHPINCVDWEMADNYCKKVGKRLPTSAEWEFAVRGPDGRVYPWGDGEPDANHLNACGKECVKWGRENGETLPPMHEEDDGFPTTAPVGSFPRGRSRYGLDDVIGNVMEWVYDWDGPYTKEAQNNPTGPKAGTERVIRGGAWNAGSTVWVRPSFRFSFAPEARSYGIGFRCAKDLK